MQLSVVIIARNEESNIARCIESVIKFTRSISGFEILLVDSASTDRTVEIASRYPINIISLKPEWPLSPAAGRFSGVNNVSGEYILLIDGDMELLSGWIEKALEFMKSHPGLGAVIGRHYEMWVSDHGPHRALSRGTNLGDSARKVKSASCSAIFRREYLLNAGNFNPYLRAEEEAELSWRMMLKGYDIYFLPIDSVNHYSIPRNTFAETLRRVRNNLWAGMGDMFGLCLRKGYIGAIWPRFRVSFILTLALVSSIVLLCIGILFMNMSLVVAVAVLPFVFYLCMCIRKKSFVYGLVSVVNIIGITCGLWSGVFRRIPAVESYPRDVVFIKKSV